MNKTISKAGLLMAALLAVPIAATASAPTNLLINGGFEDVWDASNLIASYLDNGIVMYGAGGEGALPGWTVVSGNVDIVKTGLYYGPADSGNNALDLNGYEAGSIAQSFATLVGQTYDVSFAYSWNESSAPSLTTAVVAAGGVSLPISVTNDASYLGTQAMLWTPTGFSFIAASETSTLTFTSTVSGFGAAAIDSVSVAAAVAAIPEPETYALMLAGLAVVGAGARRRKAK
jgi:choice-of-anchor C domain-containing protein